MQHNLRRLLAVLLCTALLLSCLPMAFAAESVPEGSGDPFNGKTPYIPEAYWTGFTEESTTVTYDVRNIYRSGSKVSYTDSVATETYTRLVTEKPEAKDPIAVEMPENNTYNLTDFSDLKTLCSVGYPEYTVLIWAGSGPLVISEDLTLPVNAELQFCDDNAHLIINEGVTFETSNYTNGIYVKILEVKGTFTSRSHFFVEDALSVTGELICNNSFTLRYGAVLTGFENIKFTDDHSHVTWSADVQTLEDVIALAQEAAQSPMDFSVFINSDEDLTLRQDLILPANMEFSVWGSGTFTIASGVTLEINKWTSMDTTMVVEGTLCVNHELYFNGESITFTESGRLSGRSCLVVGNRGGEYSAYTDIVKGLNPDQIMVEEERWSEHSINWRIFDITGKTRLSTPTELQWNKAVGWDWDEEKQESITFPIDKPASSLWKCGEIMQDRFEIRYYQVLEDGGSKRLGGVSYHISAMEHDEYYSLDHFAAYDPETGDYYFTVQAIADGGNYVSSEIAKSDIWHYEAPDARLGTCSNAKWMWPQGTWTDPTGVEDHPEREIEVLYAGTLSEEPWTVAGSWGWFENGYFDVWDDLIQNQGLGYYYFRVRVMSSDITQVRNGAWSDLSKAYNLTHLSDEMANSLEGILNNTGAMSEEEIRKSVQDLDTEALKQSMLADKGASGVMDALVDLEEAVGGPAGVSVSEEAADFDASKVSVVGANLNSAANEAEDITLVIDKPEKEHVVDTMYDNAVAVSFSMTLSNVEDAKNLEVPVMVTLPIPKDINPEFLVVLHYAQDGSIHELIMPHVFREGAQWYASFALTSFSDFVMTQTNPENMPHEHTPVTDPGVAPDCLNYGLSEGSHCSVCGEILVPQEQLAPLGHVYTDPSDESCNVCGALRVVDLARPMMSMYRLYNPNSGEHFYTGSMEERDTLIGYGWKYEGVGFTFPYNTGAPVHRLYDRHNTMEHMYTMDEAEMQALIAAGWEYEGVAFNSGYESEVPQYRLHNPNATIGAYHFTASEEEKNMLIAAGWEYQGIGFYSCWQ